jgi:hypothetical protein
VPGPRRPFFRAVAAVSVEPGRVLQTLAKVHQLERPGAMHITELLTAIGRPTDKANRGCDRRLESPPTSVRGGLTRPAPSTFALIEADTVNGTDASRFAGIEMDQPPADVWKD